MYSLQLFGRIAMKYRFSFLLCALVFILGGTQVSSVFARAPTTAKIAFTSTRDGNSEIYIMNPDGSKQVKGPLTITDLPETTADKEVRVR